MASASTDAAAAGAAAAAQAAAPPATAMPEGYCCHKCGSPQHFAADCPQRAPQRGDAAMLRLLWEQEERRAARREKKAAKKDKKASKRARHELELLQAMGVAVWPQGEQCVADERALELERAQQTIQLSVDFGKGMWVRVPVQRPKVVLGDRAEEALATNGYVQWCPHDRKSTKEPHVRSDPSHGRIRADKYHADCARLLQARYPDSTAELQIGKSRVSVA
eukprot:gene3439-6471_t